MIIENERVVTIAFTLTNEKGEVLETTEGQPPYMYIQGNGELLPAFEEKLIGHTKGDTFQVVLPVEQGFGERVEELMQTYSRAEFGEEEIEEGLEVPIQFEDGSTTLMTITRIDGDDVHCDMNHPLAGMELHFDVKIDDIREATAEELEHGHVHSDGHCN